MIVLLDQSGNNFFPWETSGLPVILGHSSNNCLYRKITYNGYILGYYENDIAPMVYHLFLDFAVSSMLSKERKECLFVFPPKFFYTDYCDSLFPTYKEIKIAYENFQKTLDK